VWEGEGGGDGEGDSQRWSIKGVILLLVFVLTMFGVSNARGLSC